MPFSAVVFARGQLFSVTRPPGHNNYEDARLEKSTTIRMIVESVYAEQKLSVENREITFELFKSRCTVICKCQSFKNAYVFWQLAATNNTNGIQINCSFTNVHRVLFYANLCLYTI